MSPMLWLQRSHLLAVPTYVSLVAISRKAHSQPSGLLSVPTIARVRKVPEFEWSVPVVSQSVCQNPMTGIARKITCDTLYLGPMFATYRHSYICYKTPCLDDMHRTRELLSQWLSCSGSRSKPICIKSKLSILYILYRPSWSITSVYNSINYKFNDLPHDRPHN